MRRRSQKASSFPFLRPWQSVHALAAWRSRSCASDIELQAAVTHTAVSLFKEWNLGTKQVYFPQAAREGKAMTTIIKSALIDIEDKGVLMVRSKGKTMFYFPGGKVNSMETIEDALVRECKEELDIDVDKASLQQIGGTFSAIADGSHKTVECDCFRGRYTGTLKPSSEIEEMRRFSWDEVHLLTPLAVQVFTYLHEVEGVI
jgi:8-oxo-dGTP diphosphatase